MGTITINLDDKLETTFRQIVKEQYSLSKGTLGKVIAEALNNWIAIKKEEEISKRQIALLKKGFNMGKYKFDRDELHERKYWITYLHR